MGNDLFANGKLSIRNSLKTNILGITERVCCCADGHVEPDDGGTLRRVRRHLLVYARFGGRPHGGVDEHPSDGQRGGLPARLERDDHAAEQVGGRLATVGGRSRLSTISVENLNTFMRTHFETHRLLLGGVFKTLISYDESAEFNEMLSFEFSKFLGFSKSMPRPLTPIFTRVRFSSLCEY